MPFHYILNDLIAGVEGAEAVVFIDEEGEAVDAVTRELEPGTVRLTGAYLGIALRQVERTLGDAGLGSPQVIQVVRGRHNLYLATLPEGYFLALLQRRPAVAGRARARLAKAAAGLAEAVFSGRIRSS